MLGAEHTAVQVSSSFKKHDGHSGSLGHASTHLLGIVFVILCLTVCGSACFTDGKVYVSSAFEQTTKKGLKAKKKE